MLPAADRARLLRALQRARCVLFLGSGFSSEAKDGAARKLPVGSQLAAELWEWSGLRARTGADYAGQDLQRVYQLALNARGDRALTAFLRDRLHAVQIPTWYDAIANFYWYRIYATNVDDVVENVFARSGGRILDVVDGLHERPRDRDQFLERQQYIKLNGDLSHGASRITFGSRAYAKRAAEVDPWWDQFVRDYVQNITVFVGSSLNEPSLLQSIESRGPRGVAAVEGRPGSFLISRPLDPTVELTLPEFNVQGVDASAEDFLTWLAGEAGPRPDRLEVLRASAPGSAAYIAAARGGRHHADSAAAFVSVFEAVELPDVPRNYSSLFHQGAEATWLDIAATLDAPREVTQRLVGRVEELLLSGADLPVLTLSGPRGAGKTTVLMRAAAGLAAQGVPTYFSRGERVDNLADALDFIDGLPSRVVLFVDNADALGRRGTELIETIRKLKHPPLIVLGVRSTALFYLEDVRTEESEI